MRYFDLNIEKILEGWELRHAIRELIANALDEQVLSHTADIEVLQDAPNRWHIRDFGRGLRYEHLTQNENAEKLSQSGHVIGRFGVGLKDSLATLNRRGVKIEIRSRHGNISIISAPKHGFEDVVTLHATVEEPQDPKFVGTEICLSGVPAEEVLAARSFFLRFTNHDVLDETAYGQILRRGPNQKAQIFVIGLLVAEEESFAFSYNITSLTAAMKRALNRERTNVGRTAYSDRIKAMLLGSSADTVAQILADDLIKMEGGDEHDEVRWTDVATHACQILNAKKKVLFVTASEHDSSRDSIDHALSDGYQIVTVPDNIRRSLVGVSDIKGAPICDLGVLRKEWADSFQFRFIDPEQLSQPERDVFARIEELTRIAGGLSKNVKEIEVSETMRPDILMGDTAVGLWESATQRIIIKRSQLATVRLFAGTLLHEMTHAATGLPDVSRPFESALTDLLGEIAAVIAR
jgi:hypothetical protein